MMTKKLLKDIVGDALQDISFNNIERCEMMIVKPDFVLKGYGEMKYNPLRVTIKDDAPEWAKKEYEEYVISFRKMKDEEEKLAKEGISIDY
jgi:hypothetical protein